MKHGTNTDSRYSFLIGVQSVFPPWPFKPFFYLLLSARIRLIRGWFIFSVSSRPLRSFAFICGSLRPCVIFLPAWQVALRRVAGPVWIFRAPAVRGGVVRGA